MIWAVRALLVIASCVLIAGCSSGDAKEQAAVPSPSDTTTPEAASTPSPSASVASSDPCDLLSDRELHQLAGGAVSAARPGMTGGLANCQWATSDGRFIQAIGSTSPYWAQSLPDALRSIESSGLITDAEDLKKLRDGAKLVEAGQDLDPVKACSLFSEMLELQGQPEGSLWIVTAVPNRETPMAVSGQMCSGGRFTSVMVADEAGLEGPVPIEQVAQVLGSAHRKNLG